MLWSGLHSWIRVHPGPYSVWASFERVEGECCLYRDASEFDTLRISARPFAPTLHLVAMQLAHPLVAVGVVAAVENRQDSLVAVAAHVLVAWAWDHRRGTVWLRTLAEWWKSTWLMRRWTTGSRSSNGSTSGSREASRTCLEMLGRLLLLRMSVGGDQGHRKTDFHLLKAASG